MGLAPVGRVGQPGGRPPPSPGAPGAGPGRLGGLLALLGLLLPATILASRALPSLAHLPLGQSLPLSTTFLLFLLLLAPSGLVSGYFFPGAVQVLSAEAPQRAAGRAYYLETLGAALGVALLQLFLVGRYANLSLGLAVGLGLALAPWLLARPRSRAARAALTLNLLVLAAAVLFAPRLELASRSWEWPGRQVIATVDSPYALLSASREAEQISFFANNLWQFTYPDPLTAEHQVQLGLLEHPQPRRVLLLGGGVAGLGAEILKTRTVTQLTYVELDPYLVRLAQGLLPAVADLSRDPRVHLIYQDARRFLETTPDRYDVILMALPEPKSAQLNRFYTREFYRLVARKLTPGGVFSFALPGAETSLSPLRAAYLAMAYHTLGQVFPEVVAFPGGQVRFFASAGPGVLVSDPEVLVQRLKIRQFSLQYVREYYLLQDLSPWRRQYLNQVLRQPPPAVNTDLNPRCYFFDLVLSTVQEGLGVKEALLALQKLPPAVPWAALALATVLAGGALRRRPGARSLYQVVVMGLGTMALEILVLVLYQIRLGSLYQQLGMLIAAFMAGMAAGSAAGSRWTGRARGGPRLLAGLQGGLAVLAVSLALWLQGGVTVGASWVGVLDPGGIRPACWRRRASAAAGSLPRAPPSGMRSSRRPGARAAGFMRLTCWAPPWGPWGSACWCCRCGASLPALWLVAFLHAGAGVMALLAPGSR